MRGTAQSIEPFLRTDLGQSVSQLRGVPVTFDPHEPRGLLCVYSGHPEVDPFANNFTFPTDPLRLALIEQDGTIRWSTDLGPGVVPGISFCPVYPFDLDGDGREEIWVVHNADPDHPLSLVGHRLARLDARTGEHTGSWPWVTYPREPMTNTYRNFMFGGHVHDTPVLVTAQGTYGHMTLQAWNPDMAIRWQRQIPPEEPGALGSHMCPVLDIDGDGIDEVLWGERLIELDGGTERFCADRDTWHDHSDIVFPMHVEDRWYVYTCREGETEQSPRVVMFDAEGRRVWSAVDEGHMHVGWTARLGAKGDRVAMAGRNKDAPYAELDEFVWDAIDGKPLEIDVPVYSARPVDLDGDGIHELVYTGLGRDGRVVDHRGRPVCDTGQHVGWIQPSKLVDHPGEQFVTVSLDGEVTIWADANASDTTTAQARYDHPYYRKAQRLSAVGTNWSNVAGL